MPIELSQVEHIAKLARLSLTTEEKEQYQRELGKILEHFDQLNKLDTSQISPVTHAVPKENLLREDQIKPCLPQDKALKSAPDAKEGYFQVPQVMNPRPQS